MGMHADDALNNAINESLGDALDDAMGGSLDGYDDLNLGYVFCRSKSNAKTCKYCGAKRLHWKATEEGWRLFDKAGVLHTCPNYHREPMKKFDRDQLIFIFTIILKGAIADAKLSSPRNRSDVDIVTDLLDMIMTKISNELLQKDYFRSRKFDSLIEHCSQSTESLEDMLNRIEPIVSKFVDTEFKEYLLPKSEDEEDQWV